MDLLLPKVNFDKVLEEVNNTQLIDTVNNTVGNDFKDLITRKNTDIKEFVNKLSSADVDEKEQIIRKLSRFTKNGIRYKKVINIQEQKFHFYRHCDIIDNLRCFDENGIELDFEIEDSYFNPHNFKNLRRIFIGQTHYTVLELICDGGCAKITYDAINLKKLKCMNYYDSENDIIYGCGQVGRIYN